MSRTVPAAASPRLPDHGTVALSSGADVYRQFFENAADPLFLLDESGFRDCNRAFLDLLGYPDKSRILSKPLSAVSPPAQPDGSASAHRAAEMVVAASQNGSHRFEWLHRRSDGTDFLMEVHLAAAPSAGRQLLHGTLRDTSARARLEEALRDTARGVSATTGDTFFRSLVEYLSRALRADYAFIGELVGEDQDSVRTTAVSVDGNLVPNFEYRLWGTPCANVASGITGNQVCAYLSGVQPLFPDDRLLAEMGIEGYVGTPLFDSAGCVLGLMVVLFRQPVRDLPVVESMLQVFAARAAGELERRRSERAREQALAALKASEEHFKSAFERSSIGMAIVDLDDRFAHVNQALCDLFGYSPEEMMQLTTASVSHPDDLRVLRKSRDNTRRLLGGEIPSFQVEKRYRRKDGHYFWGLVGVSLVHDADGNLLHFISQVQDITERKQAEEALRRTNDALEARVEERTAELEKERALLEAILRQMPAGVMVAEGGTGRLLLGNEQMTRILRGLTDQLGGIEDLGRLTMWHPDGRLYVSEESPLVRTLRGGEVVRDEEIAVLRGDGTRGVLLVSSAPIHDEQGRVVAAVSSGLDITDLKHTEEALRRLHDELEMQVQERTAELAQANAALQAEVQERRRAEQVSRGQTQALARTLNALTARPDVDTFFGHLVQAIQEQLQADGIGFELYDPERDRITHGFSAVGDQVLSDEDVRGWGVSPDGWPAAEDPSWQAVLGERRPLGIYDLRSDPRLIYREQFLRAGAQSVLVVPLLLGDQPMGYSLIFHKQPRRYGPEEIELAQALAQQAMLALQLSRLAEEGQEAAVLKERNRLAREIHDTLAQGFAGILIHLQFAEVAITRKPEKALPALIQARDLAKSSLAEARRSVLALRPNALENASLPDALRKQVDAMTAGTPLRPRLEVLGAPCPLAPRTEDHLLRIAQEALNNAIKYAEAGEVRVTLAFDPGRVTLIVADDGVGFTPGDRPRGGGFGHVGMRERIHAMGGELTIRSAPGQGAEVCASVPVPCETGRPA
uniref:Diguanylate cyclase/phosphodiesterase (GGDEF & EAL domains) with PAS/PAC sensor(S) n=1 Tax=uncultured Armatimonadetes bacterium TaxID=157466 RepID=A0A6J4H9F4_9BACT|nr:diguanylate cyclase/phosphodiesterase (GGDEF & EAL domains) with PAS/PAC sensor(s) [uncultured Armatimonadetes bacterium]